MGKNSCRQKFPWGKCYFSICVQMINELLTVLAVSKFILINITHNAVIQDLLFTTGFFPHGQKKKTADFLAHGEI